MRVLRDHNRAARFARWLGDLRQDLRYGARQLRGAPGPSALIVATLALGIGANATMAGAVDRLLLRPPPHVSEPDHVTRILVRRVLPTGATLINAAASYPAFRDLEGELPEAEAVAGFVTGPLSLGIGAEATAIRATLVTPAFFRVFGVRPVLGRFFGSDDAFPVGLASGGPALAVLAYGFWQRQFGGDMNVVGRPVRIDALPYTIVGVAPPGFRGVEAEAPDVWLPITVTLDAQGQAFWLEDRGAAGVSILARLRPGFSRAAVEQQATRVWRHYNASSPRSSDAGTRLLLAPVIPGRGPDAPREVKVALWLGGVSALVLLIACANVANLLLARAIARRREVAVRLALGAGLGRLARQMLAEALLLAALGGGGALVLAGAGGYLLRSLFVTAPGGAAGTEDMGSGLVDGRLFVFTAAVALGTAVLISLVPLMQSRVPDLTGALRAGAGAGGGRTSHARTALLVAQAALGMLLLVFAGLFAQSLRRVEGLDLGADIEHTLATQFDLRGAALSNPEFDALYAAMLDGVRSIPGVRRAALAERDPYRSGGRVVGAHTPTRTVDEIWGAIDERAIQTAVDSGFFRTVGASVRGRDFAGTDVRGAPLVTIVNEPLARLLWPGADPLGQCVYQPVRSGGPSGDCFTVVGVVRGVWYQTILNRDKPLVYIPLAQRTPWVGRPANLFVRTSGDPGPLIPAVRTALLRVWPDLPTIRIQRLRDDLDPQRKPWRLAATMFSLFGGVALVIAAVGLYAVVSFTAAQRSREIAVRRALGARARNVLAAVAGDGLRALLAGLGLGAAAAFFARQWIGPLLFQTSPSDPLIIAGVAALLLAVAMLAIVVPTLRTLRQSPAMVLRAD
ncbi:MAG: ADOP family duplicated permease [Gemmatimonadaceae bacterium]